MRLRTRGISASAIAGDHWSLAPCWIVVWSFASALVRWPLITGMVLQSFAGPISSLALIHSKYGAGIGCSWMDNQAIGASILAPNFRCSVSPGWHLTPSRMNVVQVYHCIVGPLVQDPG